MATTLALEPSWWADPEAPQERRALIDAFQVVDLEAATAELRARCERLERPRSSGEAVTVGEVAEVLLGQWSVAFQTMLADSQRAFFTVTDHNRLERAAEDGRAAAVAVRDRFLAPERISGHSLQQALNLANADASRFRLDRAAVAARVDQSLPLSEAAQGVLTAYDVVREWRRALTESGDVGSVSLGLLAVDRVTDLIERLPAGDRASVRSRIAANERARAAAEGRLPAAELSFTAAAVERRDVGRWQVRPDQGRRLLFREEDSVVSRDRAYGRGMSM